jgi:hypothetical protein
MKKRVYIADNAASAWNVKNLLEQYNIESAVKNDQLYSVSGEVPVTECLPEVWVDESVYERAREIAKKSESDTEPRMADWICSKCRESVIGELAVCWNCQTPLSGGS